MGILPVEYKIERSFDLGWKTVWHVGIIVVEPITSIVDYFLRVILHMSGVFSKGGGGDRKSFATVALEIEEKLISTWSCKCTMCRRK